MEWTARRAHELAASQADKERVELVYGGEHVVTRVNPENAGKLAASLLCALRGHVGITIGCPKCDAGLVTIVYDHGSPDVHSLSNGDPGYPGDPAGIETLEATCECWPDEEVDKLFSDDDSPILRCLNQIVEGYTALQGYHIIATMEAKLGRELRDNEY